MLLETLQKPMSITFSFEILNKIKCDTHCSLPFCKVIKFKAEHGKPEKVTDLLLNKPILSCFFFGNFSHFFGFEYQ